MSELPRDLKELVDGCSGGTHSHNPYRLAEMIVSLRSSRRWAWATVAVMSIAELVRIISP